MAAQTTALVDVEITKQIKININSISYENLFCKKIAELDIEIVTPLGLIIWKKYMSLKVNFLEFFSLEKDEAVKILKER